MCNIWVRSDGRVERKRGYRHTDSWHEWGQDNFYGRSATKRIVVKEPSLSSSQHSSVIDCEPCPQCYHKGDKIILTSSYPMFYTNTYRFVLHVILICQFLACALRVLGIPKLRARSRIALPHSRIACAYYSTVRTVNEQHCEHIY